MKIQRQKMPDEPGQATIPKYHRLGVGDAAIKNLIQQCLPGNVWIESLVSMCKGIENKLSCRKMKLSMFAPKFVPCKKKNVPAYCLGSVQVTPLGFEYFPCVLTEKFPTLIGEFCKFCKFSN